jgi:hypothetical protein
VATQSIDLAQEFEAPQSVNLSSEYESPDEYKARGREALLDTGLQMVQNPVERAIAKAALSTGGKPGDIALNVAIPIAGALAGGPFGGGAGAAAADSLVQMRQFFRGERESFSKGEAVASGVVGAIIPKPVKEAATVAGTIAKTAAVRGAQGFGLGGAQEGLTQVFDGEKIDFGKMLKSAAFGTIFGGGFGAIESAAPAAFKILQSLGKKTPAEAATAITKEIDGAVSPADRAALLEVRDRLENAKAVVNVAEVGAPVSQEESLLRSKDVIDALRGTPTKSAEESASVLEHAERAQDFNKAQAELASQEIEANRLAGPENTVLGNDPLKNQLTAIETRPGESASERARVEEQIAEQAPQINVEPTAELSPQAQRMYDEHGYILKPLQTTLAGGGAGAAYGSTQGDTPQDRFKNSVLFGLAGLAGGAGLAVGERVIANLAGKSFVEQQQVLEREIANTNDPLIRTRLAGVLENTKPLPDNAKITVMEMAGKRAVQVDIPSPEGDRPFFSGSPEQARAAGFSSVAPFEELQPGTYNYSQLANEKSKSAGSILGQRQEAGSPRSVNQGIEGSPGEEHGSLRSTLDLEEEIGPLPQSVRTLSSVQGGVNPVLARALTSGAGALGGFGYGFNQHPDEPIERRMVDGLTVGVLGAGAGYSLGRSFTRLAENSTPTTNNPELQKWYNRLQEIGGESLWEKLKAAPNKLRAMFTTSMASLDTLPGRISEANGTPVRQRSLPLSKSFELIYGASGKAAIDVEDFGKAVLDQIAPGELKDFNALMAIKRTGQRLQANASLQAEQARIQSIAPDQRTADEIATLAIRPDLKRVAKDTLATVDQSLKALEAKIGTARFNELDQLAAGPFQQEADKALQLQVDAGRMSLKQYSAIKKANDFYAPFRILEAAEAYDGFKGTRNNPVDTKVKYTEAITGIDSLDFHLADPTQVMQEKIYQSRILAEKNMKMRELAREAQTDPSRSVMRILGPGETAPRDMVTVNYFENGEPKQIAIPPEVAESIKGLSTAESGVIARFAKAVNRPFRFGATGGNIAFQTVNAPADQFRLATTSKYGLGAGGVSDVLRYPADFVQSLYAAMMGPQGASTAVGAVGGFYGGYQTGDTTSEKFERGAAGAVAGAAVGATAKRFAPESQLYRDFYQSGAAGATMQDMINRFSGASTVGQEIKRYTGGGVLSTLEDFGKAVEETTKILGFKRGLRIEGIKNASTASAEKLAQVVSEVRNFAGSPDFAVAGTVSRDLNAALVFLNPRIQGLSEDVGRLAGRDGAKAASSAWLKLGGAVGLASAYLWTRNNQPENVDDYAQVSPEEKNRYAMIPRYDDKGAPLYFTNDRGQKVREYYRIPLRDTAQNLYGLTAAAMDFAHDKNPDAVAQFAGQLAENLSPVNIEGRNLQERTESVISNFGPLGTVPYMLASNRNPGLHQDIYKGVVPAETMLQASPTERYNPNTPEIYKSAANIMPQYFADPLRSPVMLQQLAQAVSGGVINQFTPPKASSDRDPTATALQQSPLGRRFVRSSFVYDPARPDAQAAIQGQADEKISGVRNVRALYDQLDAMPADQRGAAFQALPPDQQKELADEFKKRAQRPKETEIAMIKQMEVGNGVRARYVFGRLMSQDVEARSTYFKELQDAKALSPQVMKQLEYLYGQSQNQEKN